MVAVKEKGHDDRFTMPLPARGITELFRNKLAVLNLALACGFIHCGRDHMTHESAECDVCADETWLAGSDFYAVLVLPLSG